MSLIPARMLATLRGIERRGFDKTAIITRRATGPRDSGGGQLDGAPSVRSVPCRKVLSGTPDEQVISAREFGVVTWDVYLPWGTDVLATDDLTVDGVAMEIKGTNAGQSDAASVKALCVIVS